MGSSPGAAVGGGDRRPLSASTALVTAALMNVASIVERADESILPAVYLFIGKSLNVNMSQLGTLTLIRGLVQVGTMARAGGRMVWWREAMMFLLASLRCVGVPAGACGL